MNHKSLSFCRAGQHAAILKLLAETFRIPVVVVNQVTAQMSRQTTHAFEGNAVASTAPEPGQLTAALGVMWAHAVNTRLVLETIADVRYIKVLTLCQLRFIKALTFCQLRYIKILICCQIAACAIFELPATWFLKPSLHVYCICTCVGLNS